MPSFWESIKVDGADMRLYVSVPSGTGPFPAVVVIQHQGGVDDFIEEMQRVASAGYAAVAPDLYHRDGPDCKDDGPTRRARLLDVNVIKDVNATVHFLLGHRSVDAERLGIVGFCMGGRVAYLMAAVNPHFKAAVDYYGGNIMAPWGEAQRPLTAPQRSIVPCSDSLVKMTPTRRRRTCASWTLNSLSTARCTSSTPTLELDTLS